MSELIIHVGMSKTASTSLQDLLFYQLKEKGVIDYFGRSKWNTKNEITQQVDLIDFFLGLGEKPSIELRNDRRTLYSEELLSESSVSKYSISGFGPNLGHKVAERLKETFMPLFSDIRLVIVLRAQKTMIHSFYVQAYDDLRDPRTNTFEKFVNFVKNNKENFASWHYNDLLETYYKLFGKDNVKILLYEDLIFAPEEFFKSWATLLNIDFDFVKEALSSKKMNVKKTYNNSKVAESKRWAFMHEFWFYLKQETRIGDLIHRDKAKWENNRLRLLAKKMLTKERLVENVSKEMEEEIFDYYRNSNEELHTLYGMDEVKLKKYGYI